MNRKFQKMIQRWLYDAEEDRLASDDTSSYDCGFDDGRIDCLREILDYLEEKED